MKINFRLILVIVIVLISASNSKDLSAQKPPYPPSPVIESVTWDFANVIRLSSGSDLWPITWAVDDNLYTSWGDGGGFGGSNSDGRVSLGFAKIRGQSDNFSGYNVWGGKKPETSAKFNGKCAGMVSVDGIIYALINMQNANPPDIRIAWSTDLCKSWQLSDWKFAEDNFFPATFLNYGRDYAEARDGCVYIYGGPWGSGINHYLARVPKNQITKRSSYEFFRGIDTAGNPLWVSDITQRQPVMADPNTIRNIVSVVYNVGIKRYIATTSHGGVGQLSIFDAPEPWGPWTTVAYYDNWGGSGDGAALTYSLPTKWISADGKTIWMVFSSTGKLDSFNLIKATLILKKPLFKKE